MSNEPNVQPSTMFIRDNIEIMRGIDDECIDLIYLDPPFNSKHNYAAPIGSEAAGAEFKDMWSLNDIDEQWISMIATDHQHLHALLKVVPSKSDKSYLVYMAVRLLEMYRILKPTGSIYLHCDSTMGAWLRIVLDAIFGKSNFRNEIVWHRTDGAKLSQHTPKTWGKSSDIILYYAKSDVVGVRPYRELSREEADDKFKHTDKRGRYFTKGLSIFRRPSHGSRPNLCYTWRGFTNPHPSGWTLSERRLEEEYQKGNIVITNDGQVERRKYEKDYPGLPMSEVWTDIPNLTGDNSEKTGYPTQKPIALLDRIIKASSNEGDWVLDPFCGCATTCVAAHMLGRKWIGIDVSRAAEILVRKRIDRELRNDWVSSGQPVYEPISSSDVPVRSGKKVVLREFKETLYGTQKGHCNLCGVHFEYRNLTIDHIVPKSKGGQDLETNLQLLCQACNSSKGARDMAEMKALFSGYMPTQTLHV